MAGGGTTVSADVKTCSTCGEEKPATSEYFAPLPGYGLRKPCRECENARVRAWRRDNSERVKKADRERLWNNPAQVYYREWRKQGCSRCEIEDYRVIDAHHTDADTKLGSAALIKNVQTMIQELAKCIALCANCHRITHMEESAAADGQRPGGAHELN